jgi:hypothetical protein
VACRITQEGWLKPAFFLLMHDQLRGKRGTERMDVTLDVLGETGQALLRLLTQPFYYIGLLFIILLVRRHIYLERRLFHVKLHSFWGSIGSTVLWGWIAGLAVTLPMLFLGSLLQPSAVLWLWGVAIALSLLRIRFLCFAYAAYAFSLRPGWYHSSGRGAADEMAGHEAGYAAVHGEQAGEAGRSLSDARLLAGTPILNGPYE